MSRMREMLKAHDYNLVSESPGKVGGAKPLSKFMRDDGHEVHIHGSGKGYIEGWSHHYKGKQTARGVDDVDLGNHMLKTHGLGKPISQHSEQLPTNFNYATPLIQSPGYYCAPVDSGENSSQHSEEETAASRLAKRLTHGSYLDHNAIKGYKDPETKHSDFMKELDGHLSKAGLKITPKKGSAVVHSSRGGTKYGKATGYHIHRIDDSQHSEPNNYEDDE